MYVDRVYNSSVHQVLQNESYISKTNYKDVGKSNDYSS